MAKLFSYEEKGTWMGRSVWRYQTDLLSGMDHHLYVDL